MSGRIQVAFFAALIAVMLVASFDYRLAMALVLWKWADETLRREKIP